MSGNAEIRGLGQGCPALKWWRKHAKIYPRLYRMALAYLSIPATTTDVERLFSRCRILLPHIRNRLSPRMTRAIICLNEWGKMGLIKALDYEEVAKMDDVSEPV